MFENAGVLATIQPVFTLALLIALPLLSAVVAFFARPKTAPAPPPPGVRRSRTSNESVIAPIVSITCSVAALGLAIVMASRLALLPRGILLVQHVAQLARLGQLDLAFDLSLDPRSATFAVVIALVGCASTLHTSWTTRPGISTRLAWTGLITAGAMLLCVGDGFAPILVGLGALSIGGWGLSRGGETTPNTTALAGNVSILLGLVFLFWSLGGAFGPEGYDPDGAPRFVLVAVPARGGEPANKSTLTMTSHAGALVSSDDADLPGEPVASPFTILVEPGVYTLRVQGGAASGDVVVPRVALAAGRTHVLSPYGPTASLRVLDDQVAVPRLAPSGGTASVRAVLANRTIGGLRASAIVLLLVLGGALAHVHALASRRGHSALALVLEGLPAPYFALRLAPLVEPTAADGALVTLLGAASALLIAANAACVDDGHRALRGVLATASSIALAAVGLGDPSAALIISASALIATASALAAIDARRDVRWLGVACAAAIGLFPGAGASSGYILTVASALGSAATGSLGWAIFAGLVAAGIIGACALAALAAFRVYDAVIRASVREPGMSRGQGAVVVALSVIALVGGTALGAGTTTFGGSVVPLARKLAGPTVFPVPKMMALAALVLCLAAAASGVVLARRVSSASVTPAWLLALGRPYAVVAWTADIVADAARFLQRSVRALDRDVVEDIPLAFHDLGMRVSSLFGRKANLRTARRAEDDDDDDDDDKNHALRTITLLVMVALLGLIVLSSFLLH
jgi:hypothetical protein